MCDKRCTNCFSETYQEQIHSHAFNFSFEGVHKNVSDKGHLYTENY